jgi:hypothetical protein
LNDVVEAFNSEHSLNESALIILSIEEHAGVYIVSVQTGEKKIIIRMIKE